MTSTERPAGVRVAAAALSLAIVAGILPSSTARAVPRPFDRPAAPWNGVVLPPPPATTVLVSATPAGAYAKNDGRSTMGVVSADGRFIAFQSEQAELDPTDKNFVSDVFVRDMARGSTIRLGFPRRGTLPELYEAIDPAISADGSLVAFTVRQFDGIDSFVAVWDRATDTISRVSQVGTEPIRANEPTVSGDGRFVAYTALTGSRFLQDLNESPDVYRFDRSRSRTVLVSTGQKGEPIGGARGPSISLDGTRVAFATSNATRLTGFDVGRTQVFVADLAKGTMTFVSGRTRTSAANGPAESAAISGSGRFVAFLSEASDLAPGDENRRPDVFRHDLETGETVLAGRLPDESQPVGGSFAPAISTDGRIVAFVAAADTSEFPTTDVFARELERNESILISQTVAGGSGGQATGGPSIGGAGRYVTFHSNVPGEGDKDFNQVEDVFLRELPPRVVVDPALLDFGTTVIGETSLPVSATLTNFGWSPATVTSASLTGLDAARFTILSNGCTKVLVRRGQACTVTVAFQPTAAGQRTANLAVGGRFEPTPAVVSLVGIGSRAEVTLDPPIGPPGIVTIAEGTGFPANVDLALSWSVGITPRLPNVRTDARGRFRVQVLVFHHDVIGERDLVITPLLTVGLSKITARMTIVTPSMVPPGLLLLRIRDQNRLRLFGRG